MNSGALGLIQVEALSAAYAAADAALKSADVAIVGLERIQGGGLMLLKITGDVASVQAAIDAGLRVAQDVGQQAIGHVIARTALPVVPIAAEEKPDEESNHEEAKESLKTEGDVAHVERAGNGRNKRTHSGN